VTSGSPRQAGLPILVKFGGELLEEPSRLSTVVAALRAASTEGPLVVVHGGGKEIDAALSRAGIPTRQVDGLRITDDPTLDVVVSILAGTVNTRLVAALNTAGVAAVGLTGADACCGLSASAPAHRAVDGTLVDLGRVGMPSAQSDTRLLSTLISGAFVPVIACLGIGADGQLLNVNADTLAGHLAGRLKARRLVIAGATPGVLDAGGKTVPALDPSEIERLIATGTVTVGMVAKLRACEQALEAGAGEVLVVDGRDRHALESAIAGRPADKATRIVQAVEEKTAGRVLSGNR
jgi:acetylglutamate kinase